jgi:hypothetical protein
MLRVLMIVSVLLVAHAAVPVRAEAGGIKDAVDGVICALVESDRGAATGRKIIARLSKNQIRANGAVMSVAIWSAQQVCPTAVPFVTGALSAAFNSQGPPTVTPTHQDVAVILRRIQASGVVADLHRAGIQATAARVQRIAGSICRSLRQGNDAASLGRELAASWRVPALAGLSGIVGLTKNCAYPPMPWHTDTLSASLATTLVANTYPRDIEPPIVALASPSSIPTADDWAEITLGWVAIDLGVGNAVSEAWLQQVGTHWKRLLPTAGSDSAVTWVRPGTLYRFAVRATDGNGNTSPYAYSGWFRA